ncbi:MAG TPA: PAS domain-containing sensor histidine kinase, partial [Methanoregulaceae archaeon]|nr:PAS domain-containing sensor histidine kinase [Methanoregulaceae archaeon]
LFLIVFGLFRIYSRFDEELRMGKEREDAVRRSEQKYRVLAESSNDAIFLIDSSGMFTYLNQYGADLFDISPEAVLGKTLEGIFSPPSAAEFQAAISEARITGKPASREIRVSIGNRDFWMESRFIPIKDDKDLPGITMGIARDITARKRDEEALGLAHRKLNLLSSITRHDVLNQLTILMGYHALMKENTDDPQLMDMLEKVGGVEDTIERMISFTRDYQDIGVHSPQWQSIREKTMRAYQQLNTPQFTLEIPETDYEVFADPLLERVFLNLMDNTVRHGEFAKKMMFSCKETDQGLNIFYEDDGMGIPESEKEQVFNQKYGKNSGFGLFLSNEILSITGIKIKEDGVYRKGIRFEMSVPRDMYRRV